MAEHGRWTDERDRAYGEDRYRRGASQDDWRARAREEDFERDQQRRTFDMYERGRDEGRRSGMGGYGAQGYGGFGGGAQSDGQGGFGERGGYGRGWGGRGGGEQRWAEGGYPGGRTGTSERYGQGGPYGAERSPWERSDFGFGRELYGRGEHRGKGPAGYTRSDERIREDVNDRLTDDEWLDASQITVQVQSGEITLAGQVRTREDKRRAEDLAEDVSGARHVQNDLRVQPQSVERGAGQLEGGVLDAQARGETGAGISH